MELFRKFFERFEEWSRWLLITALIIGVLITSWYQFRALLFRYHLDYGEAMTVDLSMRMLRGLNIYPNDLSKPDYIISNYPPLFMLLQAPVIGLFGPTFWQGRLISIVSTWLTAYYLARILHHHTKDTFAAIVSGTLFLIWPFVLMWSGLARIDCLALALATAGLYYLSHLDMTSKHFGLGAILLVAAIYTRQSYILAIPGAAFFWLLSQDWRKAFLLAGLVGSATLLIFLILNTWTQGGFFLHIIKINLNAFSMDQLKYQLRNNMIILAWPLGLISLFSLGAPPKESRFNILLGAFLVGAGLSSLTIGKVGSAMNYFLELCAALSLAAGSFLAWSRQRQNFKVLQALILLILAIQTYMFINRSFSQQIIRLESRFASQADDRELEVLVATTKGTVLADEYMGLVTLQGRLLYIQPFASTQASNDNLWDQSAFIKQIQAKEFPLILIYGTPGSNLIKTRWTELMLQTIEENYQVTKIIAHTRVFIPK